MSLAIQGTDLVVLLVYLSVVVAIGIWVGRGAQDLSAYLLGDRHLPWWAILGSIVATETSTATFLSVPGLAFDPKQGDLRFLQLAMGLIAGRLLIVVWLLPLYFRGQLFTAYQVLESRFGGATKQVASLIFLLTRNLGDGLRLFLTAVVLEKVAGWPLTACIVLIGGVTLVYTFFGGMRAVVWNDCLQLLVYLLGALVALVIVVERLPAGWSELVAYGQAHDKFRVFDLRWSLGDPFTFWAGFVGGAFLTLGTHGTDQMMVQRYLAARSQSDAGRALALSGMVVFLQFGLFLLLGVGLAAFYAGHPPQTEFASHDYVFASFIVEQMPRGLGLIGLVLAAVFAAAMSTLSSSLNSSAAAAVTDLYAPRKPGRASAAHLLKVSRLFTLLFGIIQIMVAIVARDVTQSVVTDALAIAGFATGLLLGVFALGTWVTRADQTAALCGLLAGLVTLLAIRFALPLVVPEWKLAWTWLPVVGSSVTLLAGWLYSSVARIFTQHGVDQSV